MKLNEILKSCLLVEKKAKYVKINMDAVAEVSKRLGNQPKHWLMHSRLMDFNVEEIVNFLIILGSINGCYWGNPKWAIVISGKQYDGAFALIEAFLKYYEENGSLDFEKITLEEFKDIVKGNVDIPLLEERYTILNSVSKTINEKMNGNFYDYIKNITSDEELFNLIVTEFEAFKDESVYNGEQVYIYKLAQLVVSDILTIRRIKEGIKVNLNNLVGCADYKIPQVLRGLRVLEYNKELADIVDNRIEIDADSDYEIEIRALTIVAINLIKDRCDGQYNSITINDMIWLMGQDKSLGFKPYHLTCTLKY